MLNGYQKLLHCHRINEVKKEKISEFPSLQNCYAYAQRQPRLLVQCLDVAFLRSKYDICKNLPAGEISFFLCQIWRRIIHKNTIS